MNIWKKFKNWMSYYPDDLGTTDYWVQFNKEFRENAPIRYFFMRGEFRTMWWRVKHFYQSIINWVKYRTVARYHIVKTGLSPQYRDISELLLHVNFNLLVGYVENNLSICMWSNTQARKNLYGWKRYLPRFIRRYLKKNKNYAIKYGLEHLDWEISLGDESKDQSEAAQEIKELYLWWTEKRPTREFPERPLSDNDEDLFTILTEKWKKENLELDKKWKNYCKKADNLAKEWSKEDTDMLMRLMKIRESLW
jgi:hypothetical protein